MRPNCRIIFGALCVSVCIGYAQTFEKRSYQNIVLKDFDGVRHELKSTVDTSRVTVLSFWASWCEPCKKELVELNRIYRELSAKGLNVVAINIDASKDVIKARRYLINQKITVTVLSDEASVARTKYGVTTIPRLFLIDREGTVRAEHHGFKDISDIENEIRSCLQ